MRVLFLRGEWDERTKQSLTDDDDMWIQLAKETFSNDVEVYFHNSPSPTKLKENYDILFSRGGFKWQSDIVKLYPKAKKIYYGAGRRYVPQDDICYNLVLCDSRDQQLELNSLDYNTHMLIKPAASCFKPHNVEKFYDVCFIANGQQAAFKGVKWVYETVPSDLTVLHLGYPSRYEQPINVTTARVKRVDMAKEISKCKIGIVPYFNKIDSCPRVIPEILACGLPLVVSNQLHFNHNLYLYGKTNGYLSDKANFWDAVRKLIKNKKDTRKYYNQELSLKASAKNLKNIISKLK